MKKILAAEQFSSCTPQRRGADKNLETGESAERDEDEEQQQRRNNDDRVDSLNLGVMLAYLSGPSGHHNLFEWASAIVALVENEEKFQRGNQESTPSLVSASPFRYIFFIIINGNDITHKINKYVMRYTYIMQRVLNPLKNISLLLLQSVISPFKSEIFQRAFKLDCRSSGKIRFVWPWKLFPGESRDALMSFKLP